MRLLITIFALSIIFFACSAFAKTPKTYHHTLNNGLKVFVQVNKRAPIAISQLWYKVGSSYEHNGITGISHVLEHLMFQGTKKYPAGEFSKIIMQHGGELNAMTSYDFTQYYEVLPSKYLPLAFKLEADRMQHLQLTEAHFQKEMRVVKTEKRLRIDNVPTALLFNRLMAIAHISNPYHHPVIGWQSDLDHLTLADVKQWYQRWYHPSNAVLVVVGDVKPQRVFALAKKYFGHIPDHKVVPTKPRQAQILTSQRQLKLSLPANLPYLIIAFNTPSFKTTKNKSQVYALDILAEALGGYDGARLNRRLVQQQQIAASIQTNYTPYTLHDNLFLIFSVPNKGTSLKTLKNDILKQITLIQKNGISKKELERIKIQTQAEKIYSLDSLVEQASQIGGLEAIGIPYTETQNYFKHIEKVTPKQVQAAANTFLHSNRMTVAYLNPLSMTETPNES